MKKKVLTVGSLYLAANIVEKAISFFLLPVFTKLLTPGDYGISSTYLSYVSIISVIITLSLGNSLRGAVVDYRDRLKEYMSSVLILEFGWAVLFSAAAILLSKKLVADGYRVLVVYCLIQSFFSSVKGMVSVQYVLQEKYVGKTLISILPNICSILFSILLIKLLPDSKYMGRILGACSVMSVVGFCYAIIILIRGKFYFSIEFSKYALRFSLPLVLHGLSLVLLSHMDRTMLTSMRDSTETGLYSVAYNFGTIGIAVTTAMEHIWIPWFYKRMNKGNNALIQKGVRVYLYGCALVSCGVMFLSPEVMRAFTDSAYWEGINTIPLLVIANFFTAICTIPINCLYYLKETRFIAVSSAVAAVVNLILNYLLIPQYGAAGAAFTTCISYFILFVIQMLVAKRKSAQVFRLGDFIIPAVLVAALYPASMLLQSLSILRWTIAILLAVLFIIYLVRKKIFQELFAE